MPEATYYERNRERWKQYRLNRESPTADRPTCAAGVICDGKEYAKGFCKLHYKRWYRHGVLYSPKELAGLRTQQQRSRDYYQRTRADRLAYQKARREADPEAARAYERQVYKRRKPKHQAANRARERALKPLDADSLAYEAILRMDSCSYCGERAEPQIDHIVPVASGGENHWANLTAACRRCNRAKSAHSLLAFLAERTVR